MEGCGAKNHLFYFKLNLTGEKGGGPLRVAPPSITALLFPSFGIHIHTLGLENIKTKKKKTKTRFRLNFKETNESDEKCGFIIRKIQIFNSKPKKKKELVRIFCQGILDI